jgi:hypothetical protein
MDDVECAGVGEREGSDKDKGLGGNKNVFFCV